MNISGSTRFCSGLHHTLVQLTCTVLFKILRFHFPMFFETTMRFLFFFNTTYFRYRPEIRQLQFLPQHVVQQIGYGLFSKEEPEFSITSGYLAQEWNPIVVQTAQYFGREKFRRNRFAVSVLGNSLKSLLLDDLQGGD